MTSIHATAVVETGAEIGENVSIGPYSVIGPDVVIEDGVEIYSHVVLGGRTRVGRGSRIHPFAAIGLPPQDLKFKGEPSRLEIGQENVIREHVTMNPGTEGGGMVTRIGNRGLFMVGVHVAHDCQIGDDVVMANNATLAGHVVVEDFVVLGGLSAVHQFCRIGRHAMIGGMSAIEQDVIPYGSVMGDRARLCGLNIVGLKRRGFSREDVQTLRKAYRLLFAEEGTMSERLSDVAESYSANEPVMEIVNFIGMQSPRAVCQPKPEQAPQSASS